eukprot:scaffold56953_cov63-Phaeocystis_antarctica.AAC.1
MRRADLRGVGPIGVRWLRRAVACADAAGTRHASHEHASTASSKVARIDLRRKLDEVGTLLSFINFAPERAPVPRTYT